MSDPEKISTTQISNILNNLKDTNLRNAELGHHLFRGGLMIDSTIQFDPSNLLSVLETQLSFEVSLINDIRNFIAQNDPRISSFSDVFSQFDSKHLFWSGPMVDFVLLSVSMLYSIKFSIITNTDILPVIIVHDSSKTISSKCIFLGLQIDGPDKMSFFPTIDVFTCFHGRV